MKQIAALLIISAVFLSGCTGSKWVRSDLARQHEFIVALEQRQEAGASYAHPLDVDLALLKRLMGDLNYTERAGLTGKSRQTPVFQPAEIDRLAPILAGNLAKADGRQRIRFISFNQEQGLLFSESRKTEGVVFAEPAGHLNFAFSFLNQKRLPSETSALYAHYSTTDPLAVKSSGSVITPTASYAELHPLEPGVPAPLWVVADLARFEAALRSGALPPVTAAASAPAEAAAQTAPQQGPGQEAAAQASVEQLRSEVKGKLRYLKELHEEGLISEQDYNAKKTELLDKVK